MADTSSLFREQAVEAASARLGYPSRLYSLNGWLLTGFLTVSLVAACIYVSVGHYSRRETVAGAIMPGAGVERASSMRGGIVKQVLVKSGQHVTRGEPLFLMSYEQTLQGGEDFARSLDTSNQEQLASIERQSRLKKEQIAAGQAETGARIRGAEADLHHLTQQVELQKNRVGLLQKDYDASEQLMAKQYISRVQLMQKHDALLQGQQTLLQIEQSISERASQIEQLRAELRAGQAVLAQADADLALAKAQYDEKTLNNQATVGARVVAMRDGEITDIQVRAGDMVTANQTLALVVPSEGGAQRADLWVPSRAIGFVRRGNEVRLMFDAFPYQTFGIGTGRVVEVSDAPLMPGELPVPIKTEEQMYKIVVRLDHDELTAYGRNWPLKPGMRLTADLVLEEKSFLDWLLDPLLAARKRAGT
jgi:membrane fusion protein